MSDWDTVVINRPKAGGFIVWWRHANAARFISRKENFAFDLSEEDVKGLQAIPKSHYWSEYAEKTTPVKRKPKRKKKKAAPPPDEGPYKRHQQLKLF